MDDAVGAAEREYLDKHQISDLLQGLLLALLLHKPNDPIAFLRDHLTSLKPFTKKPTLSRVDIETLFRLLLPAGGSAVSGDQVNKAVSSLAALYGGVPNVTVQPQTQVTMETFVELLCSPSAK
eukprot:jgi/Botrbrau1/14946/Bobra.0018s0050.1